MPSLAEEVCEVCRVGAPLVSEDESAILLQQLSSWTISESDQIKQLQRVFPFENFITAMDFANKVAALAEAEGHHPMLIVEWGKVRVIWWTHKIKGLHKTDFIMAAKTDRLFL